jgi:hypothetical protein
MQGRRNIQGDEGCAGTAVELNEDLQRARKTRSALLLASALGCSLSVIVAMAPGQALAADDCGAVVKNNTPGQDLATCGATTGTGNFYNNGISYDENTTGLPVNDLTVVLQGGASAAGVNTAAISGLAGVSVTGALNHNATVNTYSGSYVTAGGDGIHVITSGTGVATIANQADIASYVHGLFAYSAGGASVTNQAQINVTGAGPFEMDGIVAGAAAGSAYVNNSNVINVNTDALTAVGIKAYSGSQSTIVNTSAVTVTNYGNAIGLQALSNSGPAALSVTTTANVYASSTATNGASYSAMGIQAGTTSLPGSSAYVGITGNANVTANGYNAAGVSAVATGNVTVYSNGTSVITANRSGTASAAGNAAVYALSTTGTVTVNINSAVATGDFTEGVHASAYGDVTVIANSVSTSGSHSAGVDAYSYKGYANVHVGGVTTTGTHSPGVGVSAYTGANVSVVNVSTQGSYSPGVSVWVANGPITVSTTSVYTAGDHSAGVQVNSYGFGPTTLTVGSTAGETVYGITTKGAYSAGVNAYVEGKSDGSSTLQVTNKGFVQTYGAHSPGVEASAWYGGVTVTNVAGSTVHTRGDYSDGLSARVAYGQAEVANAGVVITGDSKAGTGKNSIGLYAGTYPGSKNIAFSATIHNTGSVTTYGAGATGAYAVSNGAAYIQTGTISTSGANALGAFAKSTYAAATIVGTSVTTQGDGAVGLKAWGQYGATVTTGAVTTSGAGAHGAYAYAKDGVATVHITGAISTSGANASGVIASTGAFAGATANVDGTGSVTVTGGATNAKGAGSAAVIAAGYDGATVNISGAVTATGAGSMGVQAYSLNNGSLVTVGNVTADQTAVLANSENGYAGIVVNGAVKSNNGVGAYARSYYGAAWVKVANGGMVTGATDGVDAISYSGSTIYNHGTVATTSTTGGFAINAQASYSGAVTVHNYADGVISGPLKLVGVSGTTLDNAGVWNVWGTSQIGSAGVGGVVNNSGTVNVAPTATAATTATVTNLATWNNSGIVSLQNGHTGDVLNLGNAAWVGTGASTLAIDASLTGTITTDKLVVGAASGSTVIAIKDVASAMPASIDPVGATVVQAASGTASSFTLAGGAYHKGLVDYTLLFNATSVTWNLVSLPGHNAFETLKLPLIGQGFSDRSTEVWYWRMQEVRDVRAMGDRKDGSWEFWGQIYGGDQTLGGGQNFAFAPYSYTENLQTKSAWGGVQFGVDQSKEWMGGKLLVGFTAGYLDQWTQFSGSGSGATFSGGSFTEAAGPRDTVRLTGVDVGSYLGFTKDNWFINSLYKADIGTAQISVNSAPFNTSTDVTVWSVRSEIGYRYGTDRFFVEPVVRLGIGDTSIDSWGGAGATMTYPDAFDFEVAPGARVGGQVAAGGILWAPYAGAYWVAQPDLRNRVSIDGGAMNLTDVAQKGFARLDFGATAKTPWHVEGFVKGTVDTGTEANGWAANVGVRWKW